ncbi:uncharacterized protein DMENIID0001_020880 [Sergentomyia squamirostris]
MENELVSALTELNGLKNLDSVTTASAASPLVREQGFAYCTSATEAAKSHSRTTTSPKYISKIYSSPRRCPGTPLRVRPYTVPERHRTRSESNSNSECQETPSIPPASGLTSSTMMDTDPALHTMEIATASATRAVFPLKKARSLEDVRVENLAGSQLSHEMEFVSSRIQKLKVKEY